MLTLNYLHYVNNSETTKDRFIAMYHIPDKANTRSCALFNATVLELVKMVQTALAIFGIFDLSPEERNGLLCDVTNDGIQKWVSEIGEPCMKVEVSSLSIVQNVYDLQPDSASQWKESETLRS